MIEKETPYARWYAKNKEALSQKRREKYANDPAYREAHLARKAKQVKVSLVGPVPDGYTCNMGEAAEQLGVSLWTVRNWREKNLFPEPYQHGKALYFTDTQVGLLGKLKTFYDEHGRASSKVAKQELQGVSDIIYANW